MAGLIDINGHPTWVEDRGGTGAPLLLLHGGMGASEDLLHSIGPELAGHYRLIAFDRRGHGYTADTNADFHYEDMATETISVLEKVAGGPAHLVGWSDGGIAALLVALRRPDLVNKLVVIGTNYHADGNLPMMEPGAAEQKELGDAYGQRSPDGPGHFDEVLRKSLRLISTEPDLIPADLARISRPVLVVAGDDDIVSLPHTASLYEALPDAQLAVVPGASHLPRLSSLPRLAASSSGSSRPRGPRKR